MKKLLLATTALTMTAGVAAAEVALSGDARMGVMYDGAAASDSRLSFTSRARVTFTLSGETDGGMAFGGSFRADNASGAASGTAGSVFVSGAFGKLTMGDVDSAFGATFGNISGVGLTGLDDLHELSHSADGGAFSLGDEVLNGELTNGWVFGADQGFYATSFEELLAPSIASTVYATPATPGVYTASVTDLVSALEGLFDQAGGGLPGLEFTNFNQNAFVGAHPAFVRVDANGNNGATIANTVSIEVPTGFAGNTFQAFGNTAVFAGFGLDATNAADQATIAGLFGAASWADFGGSSAFNNIDWLAEASISTPEIAAKVLYEYSLDGFDFALGYSQTGPNQAGSIAAAYTFNGLKLSAGYGMAQWDDAYTASFTAFADPNLTVPGGASGSAAPLQSATFASVTEDVKARDWNVGVSYTMDALTASAVYQDKSFKVGSMEIDNLRTVALSVDYTMDALSMTVFGSQTDSDLSAQKARAVGIGASYDLGGGASIKGGIVNSRGFTGSSDTKADFGLAFKF